jgi:hypothetical protein
MRSKTFFWHLRVLLFLIAAGCSYKALAADPCAACAGFPDKDPNSGRFITVTVHEATLGDTGPGQKVFNVSFQVSPSIPVGAKFEVGIFDGDVGGFWDTFAPPAPDQLNYFMFVDPNKVGNDVGTDLLAVANGGTPVTSSITPDNAWILFNITQDAGAFNAAQNVFFYHFVAIWNTLNNANEQNLFKVSVEGTPFLLAGSTIGFLGTDNSVNGPTIPIPGSPTYDGTFTFLFSIPSIGTPSTISLWDGDADFSGDTDDPNTEPCVPLVANSCNSIPFQVSPFTVPEGANGGIANPPTPNIMYTVTGPGGFNIANNDPSGGQEWERFKIGLNNVPFDPTDVDVQVPSIPPGVYQWNWKNVGVFNNIFIHSDFDIFTCPGNADVCQPPPPPPPPPPNCEIVTPPIVKAAPGRAIPFTVTNTGTVSGTVSIKPFSNGACFQIAPGSPQQVTLAPGQSYTFTLIATNCPLNAGKQPQNSSIVVTTSCGPDKIVQVEWVNKL